MMNSTPLLALLSAFLLAACPSATSAADTPTGPPESQPVLLKMIRDDAVHRELKLSSSQIDAVTKILDSVDGPWFRVRIRPAEERIATINQLTSQVESELASVLDQDQMARLDQLQNQALGTRMVIRASTAKTLGLDQEDLGKLFAKFHETDQTAADIQKRLQSGDLDRTAAGKELARLKTDEQQAVADALSNDQKRKIAALTGPSFDFSKLKRVYPKAPEFSSVGSTWVQGSPQTIDDLAGKVVAVHFYVHHCINCKRNLPHYTGWHQDYADDGLVVIGIQSPEDFPGRKDQSGRDPDKILSEMKKYDIDYPVVLDSELDNWKNWSNTMWPTVYLIDKKGYLRHWRQGELNWQGNPGEQQMRQEIEQLLSEE